MCGPVAQARFDKIEKTLGVFSNEKNWIKKATVNPRWTRYDWHHTAAQARRTRPVLVERRQQRI
jgi:hypothetical protein